MQKVVSSSVFNDLTSLHRGLCWSVCGCVGLCLDERARFGFSSALSSFIGQHRSGGIAWNLNPLISINNKQRDGRTKEIQSRADSPIHTVNFRPKNSESMRPTSSLGSLINFWLQVVVVFHKLLLEVKYVGTCCSLLPSLPSSSSPCCCVIFCRSFSLPFYFPQSYFSPSVSRVCLSKNRNKAWIN